MLKKNVKSPWNNRVTKLIVYHSDTHTNCTNSILVTFKAVLLVTFI